MKLAIRKGNGGWLGEGGREMMGERERERLKT